MKLKWNSCWLIFLFFLPVGLATVVCDECRPLDLQNSPGIGIDLTLDYGTASIKYRNETFIDVAKIKGSAKYIAEMRTLAEDAIGTLAGNLSSFPAVEYRPPPRAVPLLPIFPNLTPRNLYYYALEHIQKAIPIFRPATVISPDPHAMALTGMFLDLKASIFDFDPLIFPFIFLSIPDSIQQLSYEACTRFQIAAQQAGLELLRPCTSASRSTLYYHYIGDCFEETDPDLSCRGDIEMPMTISYTSSSLAASRIRRHNGKDQEEKYWASVKKFIEDVIGDEEVDALFLLGEHNRDPRFREVMKSIMQERGNGDRLGEITGLSRKDMGDGLWYGARGAAVVARRLMWHGGESCLPNAWCEIASYHDEL